MHELGVVFYAIDVVEDAISDRQDIEHVDRVAIKLGEVSGVLPNLLRDCWNWATSKQDNMNGCELEIKKIIAQTHCKNCGKDYETVKHGVKCPFCLSDNTSLICGDEFIVESIWAR